MIANEWVWAIIDSTSIIGYVREEEYAYDIVNELFGLNPGDVFCLFRVIESTANLLLVQQNGGPKYKLPTNLHLVSK